MSSERRPVLPVTHDACLDGHAACPIRQQPSSRDACRPAAPEGGAPSFPPGSTVQAAGLLGRGQHLRDERLGTTGAASVPDTPKPNAEIIVVRHDGDAREVPEVSMFQGVAQLGRLSCPVHIAGSALIFLPLLRPTDRAAPRGFYLAIGRSVGLPSPASLSNVRECSTWCERCSNGPLRPPLGSISARTDCRLVAWLVSESHLQ